MLSRPCYFYCDYIVRIPLPFSSGKGGNGRICFGACWMGLASPGQGLAPLFLSLWALGCLVLAFEWVEVPDQFTEGDRL